MKLAHRYTILFLVVIIVSGGVLFTAFESHRSDVMDNAESSVEERAEAMATTLDTELRDQRRVVRFAATDDGVADHRSGTQRELLKSFVETTSFDGVSVVDETGEIQSLVTANGTQPELVGTDLGDREYVQRALLGEEYISEPFVAETGNLVVVMSVPLEHDGETVGTLNGAYHLEGTGIFEMLASEDEARSVAVESDGRELYSTVDGGTETVAANATLEAVDWTVSAHLDRESIDSSVERLAVFQGLMGLVLLGTLVTFGGWVYRAQISQIGRVLDQLNALKRREYESESELGGGHEWEQIEGALAELRESLAQREQMLLVHNRILRHNLRNKLNVIRSQAEMLDSDDGADAREESVRIQRATEELLQLADRARTTERLLDPPEEGEVTTDVARVVHERATEVEATEPDLSVTVSAPESVQAACGEEISRAVDELLQNVADHAGPAPAATVTVAAAGEHVVVRVEDDGPGIPETEAGVIAGDHDITQLRHTVGIGLWLVDWIVARYDGALRVPRTAETGCVVEIELPRASEGGGDEPMADEPADDARDRTPDDSDDRSDGTSEPSPGRGTGTTTE